MDNRTKAIMDRIASVEIAAEPTNRLIAGDEKYEYPEWAEYATLDDGTSIVIYYRTTPEDKAMVEANGGDWGAVDWESRIVSIEVANSREVLA